MTANGDSSINADSPKGDCSPCGEYSPNGGLSPYWSHLAASLLPYVPGEQPKDKMFIKLNTNENPYPPSPKTLEAVRNAANESLKLYPDPSSTALRETVAARWQIKPEQVFAGNGSDEILAFAFAAFFDSANRDSSGSPLPVLFPNITYSFYPIYANLWNIPFKTPQLLPDLTLNVHDYRQNSGGVVLANPNAPTGRALSQNGLKEIAQAQKENGKVLIVDEAYLAFANNAGIGSMIPFIDEFPNLLVVRTLSKDTCLAGLRTGYAAGSIELINGLCRIRDSFNSYTVDRIAQAAAAAAINDTEYYDEINAKVIRTRERVQKSLRAIGFDVIPSQANFILASPPANAVQFLSALRKEGILVRHFKQPEIENYVRISIGTDEDMDAFLQACGEILG